MPERTVNGIHWHYEERGSGRAVVLLHAFPVDGRMFAAQLDALGEGCRVICPDLPGFGRTPWSGPLSVTWMAEQVKALLDAIGALPCAIGGVSMGGYVALAFEKEFPTRSGALILIDTKAEGDSAEQKHNRDRLIELVDRYGPRAVADAMLPKMLSGQTRTAQPDLEGRIEQMMLATPVGTLKGALLALRDRPDRTADIPSIAVPVLVLVGSDDQVTPVENAEAMKRGIPHAELTVIPGAGHLSPIENPGAVNEAIRGFLARLG